MWAEKKAVANGGKSGIIRVKNYSKDISLFRCEGTISTEITPENIIMDLKTSEIGRQTIKVLENLPESLKLDYFSKPANGLKGEQEGNSIVVYISNCKDIKTAACTVIHECTHYKYAIGQSQWAECVCVAQEILHRRNRNYLTVSEKRMIIKAVKEVYPEFNWRKGGIIRGRRRSR